MRPGRSPARLRLPLCAVGLVLVAVVLGASRPVTMSSPAPAVAQAEELQAAHGKYVPIVVTDARRLDWRAAHRSDVALPVLVLTVAGVAAGLATGLGSDTPLAQPLPYLARRRLRAPPNGSLSMS